MHRDIPTTVLCLSVATGADYLLLSRYLEISWYSLSTKAILGRIMKHLAAMGVIVEHTCDEYFLNNFSQTLAHPKYGDGFPCLSVLSNKIAGYVLTVTFTAPKEQCPQSTIFLNILYPTDIKPQ